MSEVFVGTTVQLLFVAALMGLVVVTHIAAYAMGVRSARRQRRAEAKLDPVKEMTGTRKS